MLLPQGESFHRALCESVLAAALRGRLRSGSGRKCSAGRRSAPRRGWASLLHALSGRDVALEGACSEDACLCLCIVAQVFPVVKVLCLQQKCLSLFYAFPRQTQQLKIASALPQVDESVSVEGTLRYDQKVYPDMGECLVLEDPGLAPSSHTKRLLLQKEQRMSSAGSLAAGAGHLPAMYAAGTGLSPPLPPNMAKSCIEFDDDIKEDVEHLAGMLRSNYLDAQADGAAAVAGLTSDGEGPNVALAP